MEWTCVACGSKTFSRELHLSEMMFQTRESFVYMQCADCATLRISSVPRDLGRYYPPDYYSFSTFGPDDSLRLAMLRMRTLLWRCRNPLLAWPRWPWQPSQLPFWLRELSFDAPILDVGSGGGAGLATLYRLGFRNLLGVDPYVGNDRTIRRGFCVRRADIFEVGGSFELVMANHSLEHVLNPSVVLASMRDHLTTSGRIVVRVPVMGKYAWRKYGVNWIQLDPPRHLTIFTEQGVSTLSHNVGLEVERVEYDSSAFQFWGSELAARSVPLAGHSEADFLSEQIVEYRRLANELNGCADGDQAAFILRIPSTRLRVS